LAFPNQIRISGVRATVQGMPTIITILKCTAKIFNELSLLKHTNIKSILSKIVKVLNNNNKSLPCKFIFFIVIKN